MAKFKSDAQRKAVMSKLGLNKAVTFKVPKKVIPAKTETLMFKIPEKVIPEYTEQINVDRLTFIKMKALSRKAGINWFSKDTMQFFNTKLHGSLYISPKKNVYFISSDTFEEDNPVYPRLYTIRQFNPKYGIVDTIGKFQGYDTFNEANKSMLKLQ